MTQAAPYHDEAGWRYLHGDLWRMIASYILYDFYAEPKIINISLCDINPYLDREIRGHEKADLMLKQRSRIICHSYISSIAQINYDVTLAVAKNVSGILALSDYINMKKELDFGIVIGAPIIQFITNNLDIVVYSALGFDILLDGLYENYLNLIKNKFFSSENIDSLDYHIISPLLPYDDGKFLIPAFDCVMANTRRSRSSNQEMINNIIERGKYGFLKYVSQHTMVKLLIDEEISNSDIQEHLLVASIDTDNIDIVRSEVEALNATMEKLGEMFHMRIIELDCINLFKYFIDLEAFKFTFDNCLTCLTRRKTSLILEEYIKRGAYKSLTADKLVTTISKHNFIKKVRVENFFDFLADEIFMDDGNLARLIDMLSDHIFNDTTRDKWYTRKISLM